MFDLIVVTKLAWATEQDICINAALQVAKLKVAGQVIKHYNTEYSTLNISPEEK